MPDKSTSWFSPEWFYPSTFNNFVFQNPELLYLLLLLPVIFLIRWLLHFKSYQQFSLAFPKKFPKQQWVTVLRHIPNLLVTLVFILLVIALARPQVSNIQVEQWSEGIDIMLLIDISESMRIEDFEPNRLEAAKDVARDFIEGRSEDRIGLVIFSGDAFSLAPLTTDYQLLFNLIEDISFDMVESRGTAIGSALAVATNRMREAGEQDNQEASKVLVLLSDGDNTAGNIDPTTAAEMASAYGIKMYSIGIGKDGRVPFGKDFFGNTRYVENTLDETTLKEIADIGEGEYFRVSDKEALVNVFNLIDQYEKAEIQETRYKDTTDFYYAYLKWALLFFVVWLGLKATFVSNILTD